MVYINSQANRGTNRDPESKPTPRQPEIWFFHSHIEKDAGIEFDAPTPLGNCIIYPFTASLNSHTTILYATQSRLHAEVRGEMRGNT